MKRLLTTAAAGVAVLTFPLVAAEAKPGKGQGHGHGAGPTQVDDPERTEPKRESRGERGDRGKARKCKKGRKVGFSVRGTLGGFTADDVTVTIARANKHARSFVVGDTHTFALAGARVKFEGVTDGDGSGTVDFADVAATDVVKATGKVTLPKRGCTAAEPTVTVRKIHVERPEASDEDETEQPEAETPEQS